MLTNNLNYFKDEAVLSYRSSKEITFCIVFFFIGLAFILFGFMPKEYIGLSQGDWTPGWIVLKFVVSLFGCFLTLHMIIKFLNLDTNLDSEADSTKLEKIQKLIQADPEFMVYAQPILDKLNSNRPITNRDFYHYNIDRFYEEYFQNLSSIKMKEFVALRPNADTAISESYLKLVNDKYAFLLEPVEAKPENVKPCEAYHADYRTSGLSFISRGIVDAIKFTVGWVLYIVSMLFVILSCGNLVQPYVPSFLSGASERVSSKDLDRTLHVAKYDPVVFKYLEDVVKEQRLLVDSDLAVISLNHRESLLKVSEIKTNLKK